MIAALIPAITGLITKAIDKTVADKDQAEKLKAEITLAAMQQDNAELKGAIQIITAEIKGESWLQRNWRPITALTFAGLVVAHWLGFTGANLTQETVIKLLDIVQIMIAGYVVSRGGEKIMKTYKEK
jgi:hypothetical protein